MIRIKKTIISACVGAILTASCASTSQESAALLSEEPGFGAGFGDGCATSQEESKSFSTKRNRDEYQFANDRAYRAGWRQGYIECGNPYREAENGGRILGNEERF